MEVTGVSRGLSRRNRGPDVLIHTQEVLRIVLTLDRREPVVVAPGITVDEKPGVQAIANDRVSILWLPS
jgi:hypothetical protein